jgi:UDP-glucose 4-epimerase
MSVLVTGGAGYVGSHMVERLRRARREVVVIDDLSSGRRDAVPDGVPLVVASIGDADVVGLVLEKLVGDPPVLVASPRRAEEVLRWKPRRSSLERIVRDAWSMHPGRAGSETLTSPKSLKKKEATAHVR